MRFPGVQLAIVGITAAWGLSFVLIDEAARDAGVWGLTGLRMTIGLVATLVLLRPRFRGMPARAVRGAVLGGLLLGGGYVLQTAGMRTTDAGTGGFVTAFYVALVPLVDAVVKRRPPSWMDTAVLLTAAAGIGLIAFPDRGFHMELGAVLIALSAVCWAAQIVVVDTITAHADAAALTAIQLAVCGVVGWTGWIFTDEPPIQWSARFAGNVFFLGFVTSALAFAVQAWAQRTYSPTRIATLFSLEPVFAALCGLYFDDEAFPPRKLLGCLLVGAAVAATLWMASRRGAGSKPGPGEATVPA